MSGASELVGNGCLHCVRDVQISWKASRKFGFGLVSGYETCVSDLPLGMRLVFLICDSVSDLALGMSLVVLKCDSRF